MEEKIEVLVENFNIRELEYEFGKQLILNITMSQLKELLKELPEYNKGPISARIITKRFIFSRTEENLYFFEYNDNSSFFISRKDAQYKIRKSHHFKLEEFDNLFINKEKSYSRKLYIIFSTLFDKLWFGFPISNIFFFIKLIIDELNKLNGNEIFIIFLI